MKNPDTPLLPPMLLAIAYAPASVRARLAWLLALDQRLADVLNRASEPMIAQLRLSWWRDAMSSAPDKRPKGEPLLARLSDIEPDDAIIAAGRMLIDAYEILAIDADALEQDAARVQRITAICKAYSEWVGDAETGRAQFTRIAGWWAKPDGPPPKSMPRRFRPLSILALAEQLATTQSRGSPLRLNWHALTGR